MPDGDNLPLIAFVGPLTGSESVAALPKLEAVRRGAEAAARRFGVSVEVTGIDDGRDPERAATAVAGLAALPRAIGVVGPKNTGSVRAAAPHAREGHLPMLLPAATATDLCDLGSGWVFRMCATDADTAAAATALCWVLGVSRLLVRGDDTAYGVGLARAVAQVASEAGVTVVDDLSAADAAFHAMGKIEQADAIRRARASGYRGLLLGAEGGPGAVLGTLAQGAAEGAYQLYAGAVAPEASVVYAAESEDAAGILVAAWARAADRVMARDLIERGTFEGRTGTVRFHPGGERVDPAVTVWRIDGDASRHDARLTAALAQQARRQEAADD